MRRLASRGLFGAFLLLLVVLAFLIFRSAYAPRPGDGTGASTPSPAASCSPAPCADLQGYQVWITVLPPQDGTVELVVNFQNSSDSTHADPSDFSLVDSSGRSVKPVYDTSDCPHWPRTEFNHGARRGPFRLCFKPSSIGAPLKVHWAPDFGFFCCDTDIVLTQT
jgi:hypothetical protein